MLTPYNIGDNIVEKSQENLTEEEKSVLKKLVKSLREEAAKNRRWQTINSQVFFEKHLWPKNG